LSLLLYGLHLILCHRKGLEIVSPAFLSTFENRKIESYYEDGFQRGAFHFSTKIEAKPVNAQGQETGRWAFCI
jgi:hypothetical protein